MDNWLEETLIKDKDIRDKRISDKVSEDKRIIKKNLRKWMLSEIAIKGYYSTNIENISDYPIGISIHPYDPNYKSNKLFHNHNYFELAYVYRGSAVNVTSENSYVLNEGDALLMNPHALHWLYTENETDVVFNLLLSKELFEGSLMPILSKNQLISNFFMDYFTQLNRINDYIYFPYHDRYPIKPYVQQLSDEYNTYGLFTECIMEALCLLIFGYLARGYQSHFSSGEDNIGTNKIIVDIIQYIRTHISEVSLNHIAAEFNYSTNHVSRIIRQYLGKSYSDLVNDIRLQTAKSLLENTNFSMTEIASEIGVNDTSYLNRIFKKRYGMTPKYYRQNH